MSRFRNAIFDVDGLICNTEPLYQKATNIVLAASGVAYQFGQDEYGRKFTGRPVMTNARYVCERFSLKARPEDIADAMLSLFNVLVSDPANVQPMPGLRELIRFLQERDFKLAVASGAKPEHIELMLRAVNLSDTFQVIAGLHNGTKPKPAPDVYLTALRGLGADSRETLALEDSYSGVVAAQAARLFAVAVKNDYTRHHELGRADLVAASLLQVRDFLGQNE